MKPPAVYKAIAAVTAELSRSGIAKNSRNEQEGWAFRGIDDVYNALSPLLARHKLCILPRILEREVQRRQSGGEAVSHVALRVEFAFVAAADGSSHSVEIWGEGTDRADKATNKALASAYKYAAFQVFCIPIAEQIDGDGETLPIGESQPRTPALEPVQGWRQWVSDILDMVARCETDEALSRLQKTYRRELHALSSYDAGGYRRIGDAVSAVRLRLSKPTAPPLASSPSSDTDETKPPVSRRSASSHGTSGSIRSTDHAAAAA